MRLHGRGHEGDEGLGAIDVPSLHIVGERDGAVPPEAGEHLASRFKDPVIVRTSAGHWLPRDDPEVAAALRARTCGGAARRRGAPGGLGEPFLAAAPAKPRAAAAEAAPRRRRRKKKDG